MAGKPFKRGGRWCAVVEREPDPATGKRRQRWVYGATKKEVELAVTRHLHARDTGADLDPTTMTTEAFLEHWLATAIRPHLREGTYDRYAQAVRSHIAPHVGGIPLRKLNALHLSGMYAALRDRGLSANTVALDHTVLHAALKQAVGWQMLSSNVADMVSRPRGAIKEFPLWDIETAARFEAALDGEEFGLLFVMKIRTGLRRGELLGLRWAHVHFEQGHLIVAESRVKVEGGVKVEFPKGDKSRRIDLSPEEIALLRVHRVRQDHARAQAAEAWIGTDHVFTMSDGRPVSPSTFGRRWHVLLKKVGVPAIRPHDLRHLHVSLLLEEGHNVKVVQERAGHHSAAFTLDRYGHAMEGGRRRAAGAVGDALARARVGKRDT